MGPIRRRGLGPCTASVLVKTNKQRAWDLNPEPCSRVRSQLQGHYFTKPLLSMALASLHTSSFTQGSGIVVMPKEHPVSGDQTLTVPTQGASGTGAPRPGEPGARGELQGWLGADLQVEGDEPAGDWRANLNPGPPLPSPHSSALSHV